MVRVAPAGTKRRSSGQRTPASVRPTRSVTGTTEKREIGRKIDGPRAGQKRVAFLGAAGDQGGNACMLETKGELDMGHGVVAAAAEAAGQDQPGGAAPQGLLDGKLAVGHRLVGGKLQARHGAVGLPQFIAGKVEIAEP